MKKRVLAAGVCALALLGGCSAHPGQAAVLNGNEISEDRVEAISEAVSQMGASRTDAVNIALTVVTAQGIDGFAKKVDSLEDSERKNVTELCAQNIGLPEQTTKNDDVFTFCYVQSLYGTDQDFKASYDEELQNADYSINPRYGDFTTETGLPPFLTTVDRLKDSVAKKMAQ